MTLKQFFQLSGGIVLALIFYRTPFPGLVKWPLVFFSVLGGVALAFIPLQGRPFSQWILAFFKAVYSPTEYYWSPVAAVAAENREKSIEKDQPSSTLSPLNSNSLDKLESQFVSKISDLFNSVVHRTVPVGKMQDTGHKIQETPAPNSTPFLTVDQLREIAAGLTPHPPSPLRPTGSAGQAPPLTPTVTYTPKPAVSPALAAAAATMFAPTRPNILAGVVSRGGEIPVEGAIIEIAEKATGLPVRALKTNKLGQFQIATPLADDEYVISTEKEGFAFDPVSITASGQVIPPIDIQGRIVS